MNLLRLAGWEIAWYRAWWLCFIAIAFLSARYLRWWGIFVGWLAISLIIFGLDVHWIFQDMRQHPENGRDADFVFWFGVLCRIVFFNVLLLPVSAVGVWLSVRQKSLNRI
jgi:hypothetical protein